VSAAVDESEGKSFTFSTGKWEKQQQPHTHTAAKEKRAQRAKLRRRQVLFFRFSVVCILFLFSVVFFAHREENSATYKFKF